MLSFSFFQLPDNASRTDQEARALEIDQAFGFRIEETEEEIRLNHPQRWDQVGPGQAQHWIGLPPKTLLTPYAENAEALNLLPYPIHSLVEFGAGYGRLAIVLHAYAPHARYQGFEVVKERTREGNRILAAHGSHQITCADLAHLDLATLKDADTYFLYDVGELAITRRLLGHLAEVAKKHPIQVIGRGRGTRSLIEQEHPWLASVVSPIHRPNFTIYSSA